MRGTAEPRRGVPGGPRNGIRGEQEEYGRYGHTELVRCTRDSPSQIRVGDVIGTRRPTELRLTVKMISGPQSDPRQWTFFSRDDNGQQRTSTFGENDVVRRYAKA